MGKGLKSNKERAMLLLFTKRYNCIHSKYKKISARFPDTNRKIRIPVLPVEDGQQTCRCVFPVDVCASCFLLHGTCSSSVTVNQKKGVLSVLAGNRVFKEL